MGDLGIAWQMTWATLQRRRASLLVFAGIAAGFHFITAVGLPAVGGMESVKGMLEGYSPTVRQLLKIDPTLQAEYGLEQHFAITWLHPFFIGLCAIFVVGRAAEALAGDIESGSVYLVLCRPVARWTLVLGRVGEIGAGLAAILLASWLALAAGVWVAGFEPLPAGRYAVLTLTAWCLFMALSGVALVVSSIASRVGVAVALGTLWTLVSYVLDVLPAATASALAALNPWHHYFPPAIVAGQPVGWTGFAVLAAWTIAATLTAMALFGRRDLV